LFLPRSTRIVSSGIRRRQDDDLGLESFVAAPVTRSGEPSPALRAGASSRGRGGERKGAPATQLGFRPTLPDSYHAPYGSGSGWRRC